LIGIKKKQVYKPDSVHPILSRFSIIYLGLQLLVTSICLPFRIARIALKLWYTQHFTV